MHASDRYLASGTIEDLRKAEGGSAGYVSFFKHGVIGKGLNDYDAIFKTLKDVGFDSWISIEDGVDGMEQMHQSADFLREKIKKYWQLKMAWMAWSRCTKAQISYGKRLKSIGLITSHDNII